MKPDRSHPRTTPSGAIGGILNSRLCESLETTETHIYGDVIFRSEPVTVPAAKQTRKPK